MSNPNSHRILDEREVRAIAKKVGLAKYMWDTEEGRMDLARFAHEAATLSGGPSERVRLQYEWLAPKLSTEERKSLDVIYAAASSATPEGGKHG